MPARPSPDDSKTQFKKFRMGDYLIEKLLGKGGMGLVFLAKEISLDRWVALKLLSKAFRADERATARFLTEARAIAALDHPNIVRVHNVGRDPDSGRIFMSMEYIKGQTLAARMKGDDLSFGEILRICRSVAGGLQQAWEARIVHRDIKPGNIMLLDDAARVKILDFGLARFREKEGHRSSGAVMGTPNYMSPEQSGGSSVDCRSDLYSLGVILYEMLAGARPFSGDFPASLIYLHCYANPKRISRVRKNVPSGFEDILEHLLAKKASQRYPEPAALIRALEDLEQKLARARLLDEMPLGPIVKPTMTVELDSFDASQMLNTKRSESLRGGRWSRTRRGLFVAGLVLLGLSGIWLALGSQRGAPGIGPETPVQWSQAQDPGRAANR